MNLDEIKSPLPQRRILETQNSENDTFTPPIINDEIIKKVVEEKEFIKKDNKDLFYIIGTIFFAIATILVIVWYFGYKNKKVEITTLTYWGLWEDSSAMSTIIDDYESKHPNIKINYRRQQQNNYRTRLKGRLNKTGTATTEEIPDIFRIHDTWLPMFKEDLAPIPPQIATAIGLDEDFYSIYKNELKENGSYRAVPLMYDGLALFSNKQILESAQIAVPKSWWGLEAAAVKLTNKDVNGKIYTSGVALGTTNNVDHWSDVIGLLMKQNGVDWSKKSPENIKKMKDTISFYTLFKTKDMVWDETLPNSTNYFAGEKLAFYFGPSWRIFNFEEQNPNLKFDVNPVPQLPIASGTTQNGDLNNAELTNIHWASYWVEGVNQKSKHQKEAMEFLAFLASKESLSKMYTAQSQVRSFGEIYPRKSMKEQIIGNTRIQPFVANAENASSWYLSSMTGDEGVNDEMAKYFGNAIDTIISNSSDADQAMTTLETGVNQLFSKYQLKR